MTNGSALISRSWPAGSGLTFFKTAIAGDSVDREPWAEVADIIERREVPDQDNRLP